MTEAVAWPTSWYTVADTAQAHHLGESNPADPTVQPLCSRIDTPTTTTRKPTTGDTPCADCLTVLIAAAVDVDLPMGQCLGCGTLQPLAQDMVTAHDDPSQSGAPCLGQHRRPAQHDGRDSVRRRALTQHKQLTDSLATARDKFTHAMSSGRPITDAVGLLGEPIAQDEITLTLVEELLSTGDYPATIERALGWMLLPQPVVAGADAMRETTRREGARQWLVQARTDTDQWMPDDPADTPQKTLLRLMAWLCPAPNAHGERKNVATTPSPQPPSPSALSWLNEKLDASVAATLRLCQQQPHLKHVRKALLELEKEVHVKERWDAPLRLFYLEEHIRTHRVTVMPQRQLSNLIRSISHHTHHRPPEVLDILADVTEAARRHVDGIEPFPQPSGGPEDQLLDALRNQLLSRVIPGGDLLPGRPGHRIHGIGLLSESWHTMSDDETSSAEIADLAKQHKIYTHPKRLEVREIHYSARDGFNWEVIRFRRTPDVALPRYCWAHTHDDSTRSEGAVPEALSRICNALVSDPVPIRHYPTDSDGIT